MKNKMFTTNIMHWFATVGVCTLSAVLFICANTASCGMVHQPSAPAGLERFSKVK